MCNWLTRHLAINKKKNARKNTDKNTKIYEGSSMLLDSFTMQYVTGLQQKEIIYEWGRAQRSEIEIIDDDGDLEDIIEKSILRKALRVT